MYFTSFCFHCQTPKAGRLSGDGINLCCLCNLDARIKTIQKSWFIDLFARIGLTIKLDSGNVNLIIYGHLFRQWTANYSVIVNKWWPLRDRFCTPEGAKMSGTLYLYESFPSWTSPRRWGPVIQRSVQSTWPDKRLWSSAMCPVPCPTLTWSARVNRPDLATSWAHFLESSAYPILSHTQRKTSVGLITNFKWETFWVQGGLRLLRSGL